MRRSFLSLDYLLSVTAFNLNSRCELMLDWFASLFCRGGQREGSGLS